MGCAIVSRWRSVMARRTRRVRAARRRPPEVCQHLGGPRASHPVPDPPREFRLPCGGEAQKAPREIQQLSQVCGPRSSSQRDGVPRKGGSNVCRNASRLPRSPHPSVPPLRCAGWASAAAQVWSNSRRRRQLAHRVLVPTSRNSQTWAPPARGRQFWRRQSFADEDESAPSVQIRFRRCHGLQPRGASVARQPTRPPASPQSIEVASCESALRAR